MTKCFSPEGGRIDVRADLTAPGSERVYVIGDAANITDSTGAKLPQLASVAQQAGKWAARNVYADLNGGTRQPFHYTDKDYMAINGRGAAVAELGRKRVQLQGSLAFMSLAPGPPCAPVRISAESACPVFLAQRVRPAQPGAGSHRLTGQRRQMTACEAVRPLRLRNGSSGA